ncbi:MAG: sulfite reductase flavoprotein subunit alpha [Pseudomonadota bacterium]
MKLPYIPEDAPFSEDQKSWLAGFLAGLHSRSLMAMEAAPAKSAQAALPMDILFGTQTGNAEAVATEAADLAKANGFAPRMTDLNSVDMDRLSAMKRLLVVVSTYGEGEMPDNADIFWEALSGSTAPRLESLKYGVLALGDTNYDEFCQAGKLIDLRLEQLGASRLTPRVDCDVDYEELAERWVQDVIPLAKEGLEPDTASAPVLEVVKKADTGWGRKNPYPSKTLENRLLSGPGSDKEIRHFSFDLGDSGMTYEAGDALGVMPVNTDEIVSGILERIGAAADEVVAGQDAPLGDLLKYRLEVRTPPRSVINEIEKRAGHDELSHIVSNGDKEALEAFLWGKDTLDLLNLNPGLAYDPAEFVSWLKPLQHRAYSISSSPKAHPGEVHLTVAAVRWTHDDRVHQGVASTFLADLCNSGDETPIFMSPNKSFRIPTDNDAPMVMVGPGTGIAPFRAFLEERREIGAKGKNWLFFGDRTHADDFIYEDEIGTMSEDGILSRLDLAFSRDQAEKVYVQNRMRENSKALFGWLEDGGYFYVCGDATRMAKDVDAALLEIVAQEGGLSEDGALDYVAILKKEKRYLRDVY